KQYTTGQLLLTATFFGAFQALMPGFGWLTGSVFLFFVQSFGRWIAFLLLAGIGVKMIRAAFQQGEKDEEIRNFSLYRLTALAVATSLDALAVGVSIACLEQPIIRPALGIGLITFVIALLGGLLGKLFGHLFENKFEILGGIILILLGVKMLVQN
ncbi:MAG: manganese efflux pump, partial [Victivallales bacterium]|nr:manganese efflux pump [Victivallales bacterium]